MTGSIANDLPEATDRIAPADAARQLGDWGFLAHPDLPDRAGPAYLIVAIHDRPTLRHFDPEIVEYWRTAAGRGTAAALDRQTRLPVETDYAWGRIRLVDRVHATNDYVTFGGRLAAADVGDATVAVFTSPVPLLRRGGHSQFVDRMATDVAAFFARLVVAIGERRGFEAQVGAAAPVALYAAFLEDAAARFRRSPRLAAHRSDLAALVGTERARLRAEAPDAREAARKLLCAGGLLDLPPLDGRVD